MTGPLQKFPDLDADTLEALRASIKRFGIVMPIVVDKRGRTIDGHHREAIAKELGIPCPQIVRAVGKDDDAISLGYDLNAVRRQLTPEQRLAIVEDLRGQGYSLRAIAGVAGVSKSTVERDLSTVPRGTVADPVTGEVLSGGEFAGESNQGQEGDDADSSAAPADSPAKRRSTARTDRVKTRNNKSHPATRKPAEVDPDKGYRLAYSRAAEAAGERLLTLDPERVVAVTDPAEHDALRSFATAVTKWAAALLAATTPNLRSVK